jgi:uncharacterized membrane protein (DUF485 family)
MEQDDANLDSNAQSALGLELAKDPRLVSLLRRRSQFSWRLTALMLAIYFGYILLIAFRRDVLARPIGGGVTSLGIPLGIGVILAGIVLTAIYVHRANRVFDPELDRLRQEFSQ